MAFDTLSERLQAVAVATLEFCRARYGTVGLKVEQGIDNQIQWRPTFFLKAGKYKIVAIEVEDNLYPEILKVASHDLSHFDFPVAIYQACSLEAYQADPKHARVMQLRKHGFGIITVDDDGVVTIQVSAIPLAQHISADLFDREISGLTSAIKVAFKGAYDSYQTHEGQGLQAAGQIVEGIVSAVTDQAIKKALLPAGAKALSLADQIDKLWDCKDFKPHRAALGDARAFVKEFRNTASHAPANAKQAAEKIRKCRTGFLDAIGVAQKLRTMAHDLGYQLRIHTV